MSRRVRVAGSTELALGQVVTLDAGTAHHLMSVLRSRAGDRVIVAAESGDAFVGELLTEPTTAVRLTARHEGAAHANPTVSLEVWLPLLRGGRTDDLVRQLTELGATRLVPYHATRTVVKLDAKKTDRRMIRWRAIAAEATRQCGRTDLPEIAEVSGLPTSGGGVFLWEMGGRSCREVMAEVSSPMSILVGPEGGLTRQEADALIAAGWTPVWLGPRILRAETAVVAAATLALSGLREAGF